jgi:hypothetical protein
MKNTNLTSVINEEVQKIDEEICELTLMLKSHEETPKKNNHSPV